MNKVTRILPPSNPGVTVGNYEFSSNPWKYTKWIRCPGWDFQSPGVWAFRKCFTVEKPETLRMCVTADQRYDLYLDGERIGWGSDRGLSNNWFYETLDVTLDPGEHRLVARVWWAGFGYRSHFGHTAVRPAFLLHVCGEKEEALSTRAGNWEACELPGYEITDPIAPGEFIGEFTCVGGHTKLTAGKNPAGWRLGGGDGWATAEDTGETTSFRCLADECIPERLLSPGVLPAMQETMRGPGDVRFAAVIDGTRNTMADPIRAARSDDALAASFTKLSRGEAPVTVPPHTTVRILFDADEYLTAWPEFRVTGGRDARIALSWAESLYVVKESLDKGNRDEIEGKFFRGLTSRFICDGTAGCLLDTLWFKAGRYLELVIETADEALTVDSLRLRVTHYPESWAFSFASDDARWDHTIPLLKRALAMCSHESYFDCPYYEQLMYGGDTRVEILTTYAACSDDRLPRKAMLLFDRSRTERGLTLSRVPSRIKQTIPPFSLYWVQMVYDYAMWRNDPAFVRDRLDGIRSVLLTFHRHVGEDGLLRSPVGWNFVDWVQNKDWQHGIPPDGETGHISAIINFHYVWVLRQAAALETLCGETAFAAWDRSEADRIAAAATRAFWDEAQGLYADDRAHTAWSEHAQCMAICSGSVPPERLAPLGEALATAPDLARATIYYSFYLLEAFRILKRPHDLYDRFSLWFGLREKGFRTTPESPEPTRSDCHAWGSHPLFHILASLAGIRPEAPGFSLVRIEPQPGPLRRLQGSVPHPKGSVSVDLRLGDDNLWHGTVSTPEDIPGILAINGQERSWNGGPLSF